MFYVFSRVFSFFAVGLESAIDTISQVRVTSEKLTIKKAIVITTSSQ